MSDQTDNSRLEGAKKIDGTKKGTQLNRSATDRSVTNSTDAGGTIEPTIYSRSEHNISRGDIDPDALKIMYRLTSNGHKAYLVGGGVRDLLLAKQPKDYDIATDATPRKVKALFRNCRIIGRRFKLAHIYFANRKIIEVATFRDLTDSFEGEDDSGEPQSGLALRDNKYGNESTDAKRRDITINGLFYDISSFSIIDYVGGMQDLRAGIVRVIGEPNTRFIEDPIRMIRVARHAAKAGFEIEASCLEAIRNQKHLVTSGSQMRIYEELKKDLVSGKFLEILRFLVKTDLAEMLLPEVTKVSPALMQTSSKLTALLSRADHEALDHKSEKGEAKLQAPLTPAAVLAILAMAINLELSEPRVNLLPFEEPGEIQEFVKNLFPKIAISRKDRERIRSLLLIAFLLTNNGTQNEIRRVIKREGLTEIRSFLGVLGIDSSSIEGLEIGRNSNQRRQRGTRDNRDNRKGRGQTSRKRRMF